MGQKIFKRRTECPKNTNKYYVHYSKGGYNTAVVIDKATGFVLKNSVGYSQGRFRELLEDKEVWSKIGASFAGNGETFYENAKKAGFKVGKEPKLGAIACWKQGNEYNPNDGLGHEGIIEKVESNGDVIMSQSSAFNEIWKEVKLTKSSGYKYGDGSFTFQGFVYPPVKFVEEKPTTNVTKTEETKTTTTSTSTTIKKGAKFKLKDVDVFNSEDGKTIGKRTGNYYVWSATAVLGRIRMTNSKSNCGVKGMVTFWIDKKSLK